MPPAAFLAVAVLSAALMGLAIQRGATCMVAAIDEMVSERRMTRAAALGEAAIWAGGLVTVAAACGWLSMTPADYPVTGWTVAGGVLLGLGAWVNQSCVFGAVARIGSGQWAWLATPVGFYLGCLMPLGTPVALPGGGRLGTGVGALTVGLLFIGFAAWRLIDAARAPHLGRHLWHPHRATLLIAVTFVTALLSAGYWAYTDALAALARSMEAMLSLRIALLAALIVGAVAGGAVAGKLRHERPRMFTLLRCASGGFLMGMGTALVPGSNDGLILLGLPSFLPYAWVAVIVMALSIALALKLQSVTVIALTSKT